MARTKIETASFRPTAVEDSILRAAEDATGRNRSYLLRRCFALTIKQVVDETVAEQTAAVEKFDSILREAAAEAETSTPAKPDSRHYKISRKPKKIAV